MATKIKIETISDRINGLTLTLQGAVGEVARLEAEATCGGEVGRDGVAVALTLAEMLCADLRRLPRVKSARPEAPAEVPAPEPPLQRIEPDPRVAVAQGQELAAVQAELEEQREQLLQVLGERDQVREQVTRVAAEADRQLVAAEARRQTVQRELVEVRQEATQLDGQLAQVRATLARVQGERDALAEIGTTETQRAERAEQQLEVVRETSVSAQREAQRLQAERDQAQRDLTEVSEEANRLRAKLTAERSQRTPVLAGVPVLESADEVPEAQLGRVVELAQAIHRRDHVYQAQDDGGDESAEDLWGRATLGERLATLYEVPPPPPPPPPVAARRRLNGVATHARPGAQP